MRPKKKFSPSLVVLGPLWLGLVVLVLAILWKYSTKAGEQVALPAWPTSSQLKLAAKDFTLILFAHPQCPCSKASLDELNAIIAHGQNKITATVIFEKIPGFDESMMRSSLLRQAERIPGVRVFIDKEGFEAKVFGAQTSGQVYFFDAAGTNYFQGGITPARGHGGDSIGKSTILSLVNDEKVERNTAAVFGCSLFEKMKDDSD